MTQTVTGLFNSYTDATTAVSRLEAAGVPHGDISIVASNADDSYTSAGPAADQTTADGAGTGATAGTVIGGGAGLLAGLGLLAIPGVGPVVAAGWLVATLTGAGIGAAIGGAGGGLVGTLTHAGVSEEDAHVFAEGVRRGGSLVTARVEAERAEEAERILDHTGPVDPAVRRGIYQESGWTRFEEGPA